MSRRWGPWLSELTCHTVTARRSIPVLLVAVLVAAAGLGLGLGLSEAPARSDAHPLGQGRSSALLTNERPALATVTAAVVGGRFVAPVTLGGLTVDPAPARTTLAPLGLDRAAAARLVTYTGGIGVLGPPDPVVTVGFGLVTLRGAARPAGTPVLQRTPAWVGIVLGVNGGAYNCPAERAAVARGPVVPEDRAVLFTGQDGRGAVLYDTGGSSPCGGSPIPPTRSVAMAVVPVAWRQLGPAGPTTTVSYQAPQCAQLSGVSASGDVRTGVYHVEVDVTFPFARTACDAVKTFTTTVTVFPGSVGPGAPSPPTTVVLVPSSAPDAVPALLVGSRS